MRTTRQKFNLILILAAMLTMAQTAWAADQTVTYRLITGTKGVIKANIDGNVQDIIVPIGTDIRINSSGQVSNNSTTHETEDVQIKTSHINGKIKQVEFTNIRRGLSTAFGDTYFMGIDGMKYGNADAVTETSEEGSVTFTSATGVLSTNNLTIKLGAESNFKPNSGCDLVITYEPSAAPVHAHNFSFNAVGNTLTATCGHSDGLDCSLADANYQATMTLSPSVDTYYRPNSTYSATLNLMAFNALTGLNATATDITYMNNTTGDNLSTAAPTTAGNYTASVTVTVGGTNYTLSTGFTVNVENSINSNIRQISVSKTSARNDEEITITFTPRLHELVNTLTVTGTTTNMSIGNGITKVDEYTYTFLMPYEEVTIGATFKSSDASLFKYAITTDLTGSGEVDYNADEYLGAGDAITITFMPYLQGNLEAGSVVLEGLTVTGATTNMSVGNGITDNSDNTYTFTMPDEDVTVTATAWLSADAILTGTINEPINVKQGNGIQIGYEGKHTYVNDGALPLVIHDGNTLRLVGGTDINLDRADKNAIVCEGDATIELVANSAYHKVGVSDDSNRNSGKAVIKVSPAGKTLTIRVADESTESVNFKVESRSNVKGRSCDVIGCDEGGTCGSIVVESGEVEFWDYFNKGGKAIRTTDGTITFGYKFPDDCIYLYGNADGGCSEGTIMIEDGKQYHSDSNINLKYTGTLDLQGKNYLGAVADKYTVVYYEHEGQDAKSRHVAHGMPFSFKNTTTPTDEFHEFQGWKNMVTDEVYEHDFIVTSNLELTAVWTKNVLVDGETYTLTADEAVSAATYVKSIGEERVGKHQAWFVPFDYAITDDDLEKFSFYKINMIANAPNPETNATDDIWVFLKKMDAGDVLHANMPYVYRAKSAVENYEFTTTNATLKAKVADARITMMTAEDTYTLYGTYENTTATAGDPFYYVNIDGDLSLGNDGTVTVGAYRWILRVESKLGSTAYARTMHFLDGEGSEASGIKSLTPNPSPKGEGSIYSLDGRRIAQPTKSGLYIVNGQKVVIK